MRVDALRLLRDLVAIPSVNPMRAGAAGPVERGVADHLERVLGGAGIDCERQTVAEGRENLVAVVHASPGRAGAGLMLNSHMDTVPTDNMAIDPFDPVVRDGRVYGRGACDAKGPIAAMVAAIVEHAERRERPATVAFAATVDEEYSFGGAWKLVERSWPVAAAVVGEPTRLACVTVHTGVARWRIGVEGRSAHGAYPHLGRSAIYDASRVALALESHAAALATRPGHPLLGPPSLNVGRVAGGHAVNVVPDRCELELERRLVPGEDGLAAVAECEAWVREHARGVDLEFAEPYLLDPTLDTDPDAPIALEDRAAHEAALGRACAVEGARYGTDASKLALAGTEAVVCGPGDIAQAHTRDEYLEVAELEDGARLYLQLLAQWAGEPGR
jgi:acetylornithine deacetylase